MSAIDLPRQQLLQFFRSGPLPCPYLSGMTERKLFARLSGQESVQTNTLLTQAGFRRSHDIVYRPVCQGCDACVPVRILAQHREWGRSLRRIWQRNSDLSVAMVPATPTVEQFELFRQYQHARHTDSDMSRMGLTDYVAMIDEGRADTHILEVRQTDGNDNRLKAAMLIDRLYDGYSAVYSFYDDRDEQRSLGSFLIMALTEICRQQDMDYIYLGYWISNSAKMAYKTRFKPMEALGRNGWELLSPPA